MMNPPKTGAPKAARPRSPRGHGAQLREEIIAAASKIISREGDDTALTLRGVAAEVGIAAPSVYRHFPDLEHLKIAVVRDSLARFARQRDAAGDGSTDPGAALLDRCRAYCAFATANPGPYRFLFSHRAPRAGADEPLLGGAVFDALAESIRRCQVAGLTDNTDEPSELAASVWADLHGLSLLRMNAPHFPWPRSLSQMADLAVRRLVQLRPPAGPPPADPRDDPAGPDLPHPHERE